MVKYNVLNMDSYQQKVSEKVSSFDKKNYTTIFIVFAGVFLMVGGAVAQASNGYDVSIGQNGIDMNVGELDVKGNDIVSGASTVFNGGAGQIATSAVDYTAATASDVGLGNADNADELDLDGSEKMNGELDMGSHDINFDVGESITWDQGGRVQIKEQLGDIFIEANNIPYLEADSDGSSGGPYQCYISESNGDWLCDGSKSWIHDLGNGSEAIYTSQESPQVRAVYEGKTHVVDSKKIELPEHFSMTVSDSEPMLRAQATPQGTFTKAVVMDKTDDYIEIKVGKETDVNYRITGIRDGYEDKQVVRPKEKQ